MSEKIKRKLFYRSFQFIFFSSSIFLFVVLLFNQPIANVMQYDNTPEYIRWFCMDCVSKILPAQLPLHRYASMECLSNILAVRMASILVQTLFLLVIAFLYIQKNILENLDLKEKIAYLYYSNVIASLISFLLLLPIVFKIKFLFSRNLFHKMIVYSWNIMPAGLVFSL